MDVFFCSLRLLARAKACIFLEHLRNHWSIVPSVISGCRVCSGAMTHPSPVLVGHPLLSEPAKSKASPFHCLQSIFQSSSSEVGPNASVLCLVIPHTLLMILSKMPGKWGNEENLTIFFVMCRRVGQGLVNHGLWDKSSPMLIFCGSSFTVVKHLFSIAHGYILATMAEMNSCDRDSRAHKAVVFSIRLSHKFAKSCLTFPTCLKENLKHA